MKTYKNDKDNMRIDVPIHAQTTGQVTSDK